MGVAGIGDKGFSLNIVPGIIASSIRRSSEEVLRVLAVALNRLEFAFGSEALGSEARGSIGRLLLLGI